MTFKIKIYNLILGILFITTIYFSFVWASNDDSGEAKFAILTSILIPVVFFLRREKEPTYDIQIETYSFKKKTNTQNIDIEYPIVKYKDNTLIESKINQMIEDHYLNYGLDISTNTVLDEDIEEFTSYYDNAYKIKNIFGLILTNYRYFDGAAHGNVDIVSMNINLENGGEFEFKDLFKSFAKEELIQLVKQKLLNSECKDDLFDIDSLSIRDNQDFYIDNSKLVIIFFKYEIAPGSCGPIEVSLELKELVEYLNPSGPFSFLYNPIIDGSRYSRQNAINYAMQRTRQFYNELNTKE